MAVFLSREINVSKIVIQASITGSGDKNWCYVNMNGTSYYSECSGLYVSVGDEVTFCVYTNNTSSSDNNVSTIKIDGNIVFTASGKTAGRETYTWVVPGNIRNISIDLLYKSSNLRYSNITVTTS